MAISKTIVVACLFFLYWGDEKMYNQNNYGYNPYGTYIPQRPIQQPMTQPLQQPLQTSAEIQRPLLKMVDTLETARITEYPLDGTTSYFPLTDGSAIVSKQLQMDGTSKTIIYKPVTEEQKEQPKYLIEDDLEDLKEDIRDIKSELKDLRKKKKDD